MAFNINTFITSMFRDGARPNLFDITLGIPNGLAGLFPPANITLRAKATTLPSATIGVASTYYFGRQAKFAGNKVFGDWTVNILMDETDFLSGARAFLETWSNNLSGHVQNTRNPIMVNPVDYMMDGTVTQYAKDGTAPIGTYKMVGCFPTDVGAIPVDWEANDRIMEFQVTFAMQWWERVGFTDVSGGI